MLALTKKKPRAKSSLPDFGALSRIYMYFFLFEGVQGGSLNI